jgi:hypothetical protein
MIECTNYKPVNKGSLLGYADLLLIKSGMQIFGCSLHQKDGGRWVNMPSREYTNDAGEKKYLSIVRFQDPERMKAFSVEAMKAIEKKTGQMALKKVEVQDDLPF